MSAIHAKDIMIPLEEYPHVPDFFTLKQAVAIIEGSTIDVGGRVSMPRSLLVFDREYRLVGVVRRRDILRGLEPEFLSRMPLSNRRELFGQEVDPNLLEFDYDKIESGVRKQGALAVAAVTQPLRATVDHEDHISKMIHAMVTHHQNLLPVVKDGRVVGVVRSVELFHAVAKLVI
ncbi:MAG: CBS domain-containing protein [bacterium]